MRTEFVHIALKISVLFAKFCNSNILFCQFSAKFFRLFGQISDLSSEGSNRLLHLFAQFRIVRLRSLHLLAKIVDQIVIETDRVFDELHIFHDVCTIGLFALTTFDGDAPLRFIDFAEAVLNVIHGRHHVRQLLIFLRNNLLQRISSREFSYRFLILLRVARNESHTEYGD